jgi:hypothetical protein
MSRLLTPFRCCAQNIVAMGLSSYKISKSARHQLAAVLLWGALAAQAQVFTGDSYAKETMRKRITFPAGSVGTSERFHGNPAVTTNGFVTTHPSCQIWQNRYNMHPPSVAAQVVYAPFASVYAMIVNHSHYAHLEPKDASFFQPTWNDATGTNAMWAW